MAEPAGLRAPPLPEVLAKLAGSDPASWANRLREDQRNRWRAGQRIRVEDYLAHLPALSHQPEPLLDLIYGEVLLREAGGERPMLEELQKRFPAHREALARQWEVHQVIEKGELPPTVDGLSFQVEASPPKTPRQTPGRPAPPLPEAPAIGGYEILSELGRGGNGVVYLARQRSLDRLVAIKMITPHDQVKSAKRVARLRSEAALMARLRHPQIVSIYRVGLCENRLYLVLEYVPGGSLDAKITGQPWPAARAAALVESLARTLAVVHEQGIVHRDLKPGNILGEVPDKEIAPSSLAKIKIVDFGLAKALDHSGRPGMTHTGEVVGTPLYMAPEQALGKKDLIGPATDQHALGIIFYELLTGKRPFQAPNPVDLLSQIVYSPPVPPSHHVKEIAPDFDAIVLRCLAKEPGKRYPTTLALAEDLHRVRHGFPSRARRPGRLERLRRWARREPVAAGLVLAVLIALLGGLAAVGWQWRRAENALEGTERARGRETAARQRVEQQQKELRESFSSAEAALARSLVALAETERLRGNLARAEEHLAACPPAVRDWEWRYLARLCHLHLATLDGPGDAVTGVAISPQGQLYAAAFVPSGGRRPSVQVWKGATGKTDRVISEAACVAFHPSGRWLGVGGANGGVRLFSLRTKEPGPIALGEKASRQPFRQLAFSPDGKYLAAERGTALQLWTFASDGKPEAAEGMAVPLPWPKPAIRSIAFRPDSKLLAMASRSQVFFWDLERRQLATIPSGNSRPWQLNLGDRAQLRALTWSDDGQLLFVGGLGGHISAFPAPSLQPKGAGRTGQDQSLFILEGHTSAIERLASHKMLLASVAADGTARVWDLTTRKELVRVPGARAVALDLTGKILLTPRVDGRLAVWRTRPAAAARPRTWHKGNIFALAFSPAGPILASAGMNGVIAFHHPGTYREAGPSWRAPLGVFSLAYHPQGRLLAVGLARDVPQTPRLHLLDVIQRRTITVPNPPAFVWALAFSPDGRLLAAAGKNGRIHLWKGSADSFTWIPFRTLPAHQGAATGIAFGPDGRSLASTGQDGKLLLWSVADGKCLRELSVRPARSPDEAVRSPATPHWPGVAFSPDGQQLATPGRSGAVVLVNVVTGAEKLLIGHTGDVGLVVYSPDGKRLASGAADGTVRLWDPHRQEEVLTIGGYKRPLLGLAISRDGRFLATSAKDRTIVIHDAPLEPIPVPIPQRSD